MKRVTAVMLVALLMAELVGLEGVSVAGERQAAPGATTGRPEVVKRLAQIPVKSVVRIERVDGTKLNALLEEVTPDAITVTVLEKDNRAKETIPIADIKKIEIARGHTLRNILLGVGIGVGILVGVTVGACAASAADSPAPATGDGTRGAAH
jgi:hypothetical protein